jgi:ribonuclease-3
MNDTWEEEIQDFLNSNFGFRTEKIDLYKEALTHSSNGLQNNQRLAFLGDAVLKLIIREYYFTELPDWTKGRLTSHKYDLIETDENYAKIATNLNIFEHIKLGGAYNNRRDDANNTTVNAEAFEAIFGAIYLDKGFVETKKIVERLNRKIPFL